MARRVAGGATFLNLEDDTGTVNWRERALAQKCRGYSADGVVHTLSTLIFNRVLNAARNSSLIPMLTA